MFDTIGENTYICELTLKRIDTRAWSSNVKFRFRVIDITVSDTKARIPRRMRIHCTSATFFSRYLERHYRQTACIAMTSIAPRTRVHVHSDEVCNVHKDIERLSLRSEHERCASRIRIFTVRHSSHYTKRFLRLSSVGSEYLRWVLSMNRLRKFSNDITCCRCIHEFRYT